MTIDGHELTECPLVFIGDDMASVNAIIEAAEFWERGWLPIAGGYLDQAAACMDGIVVVQDTIRFLEKRAKEL